MNNETRKLNPELGIWTPWNVQESAETLSDTEFAKQFGHVKAEAIKIAGPSKLSHASDLSGDKVDAYAPALEKVNIALKGEITRLKDLLTASETAIEELNLKLEDKGGDVVDTVPFVAASDADTDDQDPIFTDGEAKDIDELHWKQFESKYGMKPADFKAKREAGESTEEGGEDDSPV